MIIINNDGGDDGDDEDYDDDDDNDDDNNNDDDDDIAGTHLLHDEPVWLLRALLGVEALGHALGERVKVLAGLERPEEDLAQQRLALRRQRQGAGDQRVAEPEVIIVIIMFSLKFSFQINKKREKKGAFTK